MKISDIYDAEVMQEQDAGPDLVDHIRENLHGVNWDAVAKTHRLVIRVHLAHCADGERVCNYSTVWLDEEPIMLCRCAGRGGRDKFDEFVTNLKGYNKMIAFLHEFMEEEGPKIFDPNADIPELNTWYNMAISPESFGIVPEYKLRLLEDFAELQHRNQLHPKDAHYCVESMNRILGVLMDNDKENLEVYKEMKKALKDHGTKISPQLMGSLVIHLKGKILGRDR